MKKLSRKIKKIRQFIKQKLCFSHSYSYYCASYAGKEGEEYRKSIRFSCDKCREFITHTMNELFSAPEKKCECAPIGNAIIDTAFCKIHGSSAISSPSPQDDHVPHARTMVPHDDLTEEHGHFESGSVQDRVQDGYAEAQYVVVEWARSENDDGYDMPEIDHFLGYGRLSARIAKYCAEKERAAQLEAIDRIIGLNTTKHEIHGEMVAVQDIENIRKGIISDSK